MHKIYLDLGEVLFLETGIRSARAIIHEEKAPDPVLALAEAPGDTADGDGGDSGLGDKHTGLEAVDAEVLTRT